jgi:predicted peroxiredoxin/TusA-related sulfurtransferase
MMTTTAPTSLDMRGRTITTFIAYQADRLLGELSAGQELELRTDIGEDIDSDIRAWCRTTGQELVSVDRAGTVCDYLIRKRDHRPGGKRVAMVISEPGLEKLLAPLGFALAAALEGSEVSLYFQGPAVRVLATGFVERLSGWNRPFSRFARAALVRAGHLPAQQKLAQLRTLGGHLYVCGPSMRQFRVTRSDLVFDDVTVAEYLTFMAVMAEADIQLLVN